MSKRPQLQTQFIIFVLFGDVIIQRGGQVWTASLLQMLEVLGVSERAARSTLSRMTRKGWLKPERDGRHSMYALTAKGRRILDEGGQRIFEPRKAEWDGHWHMVVYSLPENKRKLRNDLRKRLAWLCLAFLLASWQTGDWLFSYYDLVRQTEPPFPGYADVAYYAGYVAFIAAIPLLTFPERRLHDRRWLFDAGVVTVIAGTISWEYLLRPIVADSGSGYFEAAVALGYPLFDLVLLTTLVVTLFAARDRYPVYVLALIAAVVFQVFTDAGYTYLITTVGYDNVGNPLEIGWLAGTVTDSSTGDPIQGADVRIGAQSEATAAETVIPRG